VGGEELPIRAIRMEKACLVVEGSLKNPDRCRGGHLHGELDLRFEKEGGFVGGGFVWQSLVINANSTKRGGL